MAGVGALRVAFACLVASLVQLAATAIASVPPSEPALCSMFPGTEQNALVSRQLLASLLHPTIGAARADSLLHGLSANGGLSPVLQRNSVHKWHSVLHKLMHGHEEVTLLWLGGSMVAGHGCEQDHQTYTQCSYPGRFEANMRQLFPAARLRVVNTAAGGTSTASTLVSLPMFMATTPEHIDMIVTDFSVNDAHDVQAGGDKFGATVGDANLVYTATEVLVRYVLEQHPDIALMMIEAEAVVTGASPTAFAHRAVAEFYAVPFVNYRDLAMKARELLWLTPRVANPVHPGWETHDLLGATLALLWRQELGLLCARARLSSEAATTGALLLPPLSSASQRERFAVCKHPLTIHDAVTSFKKQGQDKANAEQEDGVRISPAGSWRLYADRPDKPGWISEGPSGAAISFRVTFGALPRLAVSWLRSYESFADATLEIGGAPHDRVLTLVGTHHEHTSTTFGLSMDVHSNYFQPQHEYAGVLGFSVPAHATVDVTIRHKGGPGKVKIIDLVSCCRCRSIPHFQSSESTKSWTRSSSR